MVGGELAPPITLDGQPFALADVNGDGRPDLLGTHFDEGTWTYHLDVWLNVTP